MAPHRKSPIHDSAAMLSQVHPSEAIWVVFEQNRHSGELTIHLTGRFMTEFKVDPDRWIPAFTTTFQTNYSDPYFGQLNWSFSTSQLGLTPEENINWFNKKMSADEITERQSSRQWLVPDRRDQDFMWQRRFVVKLQDAHKVFGCSPQEFHDHHLAEFHRNLKLIAEYKLIADEEDREYAAAQEDAWAEIQ